MDEHMPSDAQLMRSLARHLRIHEVLCFDPDDQREQKRAEVLVEWFARLLDGTLDPPMREQPAESHGERSGHPTTPGNTRTDGTGEMAAAT